MPDLVLKVSCVRGVLMFVLTPADDLRYDWFV
jgi:hypothetical protein